MVRQFCICEMSFRTLFDLLYEYMHRDEKNVTVYK